MSGVFPMRYSPVRLVTTVMLSLRAIALPHINTQVTLAQFLEHEFIPEMEQDTAADADVFQDGWRLWLN